MLLNNNPDNYFLLNILPGTETIQLTRIGIGLDIGNTLAAY